MNEPIEVQLPEYPCRHVVTGFRRERGAGPMLTLATATVLMDGRKPIKTTDYVTQMRLADLLSCQHSLPVNADKLYGPRGRRCEVGRK